MEAGLDLMEVEKYMQKNNVLRKRDYERYEIMIPFIYTFGKRKEKFLCSELEKMHPCFSDEFTIDTSIKGITRKGFFEDVYVMNKLKLAEYERKRSIAGAGFFAEKESDIAKTGLNFPRRIFVEKKLKLTVYGVIFCLLLGITGIICGSLAGKALVFADEVIPVNEELEASQSEKQKDDKKQVQTVRQLEEKIFLAAAESGGKISKFELFMEKKREGDFENLRASIKGIFPESLADYGGDTVLYENGIPFMNVYFESPLLVSDFSEKQIKAIAAGGERAEISTVPFTGAYTGTFPGAATDNLDFNKKVREIILKHNCVLKEEKPAPYHIEFSSSKNAGAETKELLNELAGLLSQKKRSLTAISINQNGERSLQIALSIENKKDVSDFYSAFDLSLISENLDLFIDDISERKRENLALEKLNPKTSENISGPEDSVRKISSQQKIGEIKKSDKISVIFYKNEEGRIERRIQTAGEEI